VAAYLTGVDTGKRRGILVREYDLLRALASGLTDDERRSVARALADNGDSDGQPRPRLRRRVTAPAPRRAGASPAYRRSNLSAAEIDELLG